MHLRVPGYQLSSKNRSYDQHRLIGRLDRDLAGFEVLMEKMPPLNLDLNTLSPVQARVGARLREQSLRGVE